MMMVNYSEDGSGTSLLDISDPANPGVTFTDGNNPPTPYSTLFNGGRLYSAGKVSKKLGAFTIQFDSQQAPERAWSAMAWTRAAAWAAAATSRSRTASCSAASPTTGRSSTSAPCPSPRWAKP